MALLIIAYRIYQTIWPVNTNKTSVPTVTLCFLPHINQEYYFPISVKRPKSALLGNFWMEMLDISKLCAWSIILKVSNKYPHNLPIVSDMNRAGTPACSKCWLLIYFIVSSLYYCILTLEKSKFSIKGLLMTFPV